MFEDTYKILVEEGDGLYKEKGSKFIAKAFAVHSEEEVKARVAEFKKQYFDARHHCYAFIMNPDKSCYRSADDGEPSGPAGKPILNQILSKDVTNVCVVVVRYFGGIKLGVPGLINAYKTAAREALDNATIIEKTIDVIDVAASAEKVSVNTQARIASNISQPSLSKEIIKGFTCEVRLGTRLASKRLTRTKKLKVVKANCDAFVTV